MLENLGDIFEYTNTNLLDGELDSLSDIISYLEEAQNKIVEKAKVEAPILTITLTSNEVTLPDDFMFLKKIMVNGVRVEPEEKWDKILYLPENIKIGTAKLYYYKKPRSLDGNDLSQVPDIDSRYFYNMAQYAAEMYRLMDDDEQQARFAAKFFEGLMIYSTSSTTQSKFKNVW